jgi:hypothetical protein
MRQPDLCDGCFQPLPEEFANTIALDVYDDPDDEDYDEDDDPLTDEGYTHRFHNWGCVWIKAGRECEELPSIPLGDTAE